MNDSEYFTEDNRKYVDPNVSLNEQNKFVDNLRNIQAANTERINRQTHALGSNLPSNLGGLGGSEGLFKARYQTPQTNAMVADLKAVMQQNALNTALSNYSDMINKKYKDRYKKYVYDNTKKPASTDPNSDKGYTEGDPTTEGKVYTGVGSVPGNEEVGYGEVPTYGYTTIQYDDIKRTENDANGNPTGKTITEYAPGKYKTSNDMGWVNNAINEVGKAAAESYAWLVPGLGPIVTIKDMLGW